MKKKTKAQARGVQARINKRRHAARKIDPYAVPPSRDTKLISFEPAEFTEQDYGYGHREPGGK